MKRFLAPLTVALLFALVMITVVGGVAFGAIVVPRLEAEGMSETSGFISVVADPDGTGPAGPNLRWASGAGVTDRAQTRPTTQPINVPAGTTVNQIQLFTRQASANTAEFAIYVDGTALANRVGTFRPPAGSTWAIRTVNLTTAIQPGTHTLHIGPNAPFSNNAFIDWFELHNTGTAPPPTDTDSDGVPDDTDQCDTQPGPASNNGCPVTGGTTFKLVGAGDIADAGNADLATGNLIDAIIAANPNTIVFTTGDNAYPSGSASDYSQKYEPTWGPFKMRTRPSPGNHDYRTSGASGYKNYFQGVVPTNPTYYAYNLGDWRIYSLDSNISMASGSAQYNWLANDLTNNPRSCVAAYWHHPTASSGQHGPTSATRPVFALLDQRGAELVISGHDHNYERFGKINSSGANSSTGVVKIVVGTGGTELRPFTTPQGNSIVRNADTHGILDLTLSATGYTGRFVPAQGFGNFTDSFSGTCTN
jgi:hypothetical protein